MPPTTIDGLVSDLRRSGSAQVSSEDERKNGPWEIGPNLVNISPIDNKIKPI